MAKDEVTRLLVGGGKDFHYFYENDIFCTYMEAHPDSRESNLNKQPWYNRTLNLSVKDELDFLTGEVDQLKESENQLVASLKQTNRPLKVTTSCLLAR